MISVRIMVEDLKNIFKEQYCTLFSFFYTFWKKFVISLFNFYFRSFFFKFFFSSLLFSHSLQLLPVKIFHPEGLLTMQHSLQWEFHHWNVMTGSSSIIWMTHQCIEFAFLPLPFSQARFSSASNPLRIQNSSRIGSILNK